MIKVLEIVNRFNLGGVTYNAAYLTKYMPEKYETILVGGPNDKTEKNSEYIVNSLGITPVIIQEMRREINFRQDVLAYKQLKKIIEEFKPDIVHTHASKAGALGRRAAKDMGVKVIIHTFHGHVFDAYFNSVKSKFYQGIERRLAKKTDVIIAISEKQKIDLVDKYKICEASKVRVISLGFDLSKFTIDKDIKRKKFREKYELNNEDIVIGIVGRIVPIKNHEMFIESFVQLKRNTKRRVKAFIVGDGELRDEIEKKAIFLGLKTSSNSAKEVDVVFTSWIREMDVLNAAMDIVALTSLNEGTPVSLIEAQASGVPIVSTNVGGVEDIVDNTALLVESGDVEGFADSLKSLVENDVLRKKISEERREQFISQFSYNNLIDKMSKLYEELLG